MEQIQELESARLRLRPWRDTDLAAFAAMCADHNLAPLQNAEAIERPLENVGCGHLVDDFVTAAARGVGVEKRAGDGSGG